MEHFVILSTMEDFQELKEDFQGMIVELQKLHDPGIAHVIIPMLLC